MKLITELTEDVNYLVEEKEGKKFFTIEGVFLQAGIKNRNGRIYPPPVMEREVNRYTQDKVKTGSAYGELGHPDGPKLNLERISHRITELRKSGNDYIGKARLIDEGFGKIARGIMEAEGRLGVSSRGMGSLKEDAKVGAKIVQDDFFLAVGADIVADPSAPSAWVNGIMENVEWVLTEQGNWEQVRLDEIRRDIHSTPANLLPEKKIEVFNRYLEDLMERDMIKTLAKHAQVGEDVAAQAVKKARIRARIDKRHNDARYVYGSARNMLVNK